MASFFIHYECLPRISFNICPSDIFSTLACHQMCPSRTFRSLWPKSENCGLEASLWIPTRILIMMIPTMVPTFMRWMSNMWNLEVVESNVWVWLVENMEGLCSLEASYKIKRSTFEENAQDVFFTKSSQRFRHYWMVMDHGALASETWTCLKNSKNLPSLKLT